MRKGYYFVRFGRHGRLMRDTDGAGGGTPGGDAGNAGGNSGDSAQSGGDSNNSGEDFDPSAFWGGSGQGGSSASSEESAGGSGSDSNTGGSSDGENISQTLTQQLENLSFGDPIFTNEIAEQINNGDFNGVQERFNAMGQNIVRQALSMTVQILRPFAEQIQSQMREEFQGTLTNRDNNDTLVRDFPAAKDPRVAPVIKQIFSQALKNTGNNRERAVSQTKEMLRFMAGQTASDLDLSVAPRGAEDSGRPINQNINWLDELSARR